jgi:citrate synthase
VFLLWNGRLPKRTELDELKQSLAASYELNWEILELIKGMADRVPKTADPMDRLRTIISALAMFDEEARDLSRAASIRVATRLTGALSHDRCRYRSRSQRQGNYSTKARSEHRD